MAADGELFQVEVEAGSDCFWLTVTPSLLVPTSAGNTIKSLMADLGFLIVSH
jgi:hypothetical protein